TGGNSGDGRGAPRSAGPRRAASRGARSRSTRRRPPPTRARSRPAHGRRRAPSGSGPAPARRAAIRPLRCSRRPPSETDVSALTVRSRAKHVVPRLERMLALLAISLGYLMVILDATAVTVVLPVLGDDFGVRTSALQWVLDAYTLVFAALLLSGGAL